MLGDLVAGFRDHECAAVAEIADGAHLVVLGHERDGLADKLYEFRDGHVREFLGGVSDFLETRRIENLNELERHAKPEAEQTVVAELAAKKEAAQQEYKASAATVAIRAISPVQRQYAPLSIGRFPTNFPVCPFIAKLYISPFHLAVSSHTGYKAYFTVPLSSCTEELSVVTDVKSVVVLVRRSSVLFLIRSLALPLLSSESTSYLSAI